MTKDIKDYLHFYLGCEITDGKRLGILCGVATVMKGYRICVLHTHENNRRMNYHIGGFKPILRPLILSPSCDSLIMRSNRFKFLLSEGFDLFGLIDADLAIDATTLNQPA